jgi:hypothetical protein
MRVFAGGPAVGGKDEEMRAEIIDGVLYDYGEGVAHKVAATELQELRYGFLARDIPSVEAINRVTDLAQEVAAGRQATVKLVSDGGLQLAFAADATGKSAQLSVAHLVRRLNASTSDEQFKRSIESELDTNDVR